MASATSSKYSAARLEPIIAFQSLPVAIRELIDKRAVRQLSCAVTPTTIDYITAADIKGLVPMLERLQPILKILCSTDRIGE